MVPAAIADITLNVDRFAYLYSSNNYFMLTLNLINNLTHSFLCIYYGIGFFINLLFNNKFRFSCSICNILKKIVRI
jgi:hypothetical protein